MRRVPLFCTLVLLLLSDTSRGDLEIEPAKPHAFYLTPNEHADLVFSVKNLPEGEELKYAVRDYWGQSKLEATAVVDAANTVTVPVEFATGYYEVVFPTADLTFGLVVRPESEPNPDGVFGLDCGLSWGSSPGLNDEIRAAMPQILRKSGISMARERLAWWGICRGSGAFTWGDPDGALRYELVRDFYRKGALPVLECFTEAPDWLGANNFGRPYDPFPKDLIGAADCWEGMADKFGDVWGAVEVSNEPDNHPIPADYYVPLAKAMAWGLREAGWKGTLVGLSCAERTQVYKDTAMDNGLLDVCDAISFHTYNAPITIQPAAKMYRDLFKVHGRESKPIWLSESGWPWPTGTRRPAPEVDNECARVIAMKGIECQANGIAKFFAFYLQYHEESLGNFGMTGRSFTPLRSMAAYMQAARVIGPKTYLGDLRIDNPLVELARVFGLEKEIVAVVYMKGFEPGQTIDLNAPVKRIEGIDGRELKLADNGAIPVPDGMAYLYLDPAKAARYIIKDTEAARLLKLSRQPATPSRPVPVALQPLVPMDSVQKCSQIGYRLTSQQAAAFEITVGASNFTADAKAVTVRVSCHSDAKMLSGDKETQLTLEARSREELKWVFDLSTVLSEDEMHPFVFRVVAEDQKGEELDRMAMYFYRVIRPIRTDIPQSRGRIEIDGVLAPHEWDHVPAIRDLNVVDAANPSGKAVPDDLSGFGKFQWSKDGLYFAVLVYDQKHRQTQPPQLNWRQDSIQIACASLYDPKQPFKQAQYEFGGSLDEKGSVFYRYSTGKLLAAPSRLSIVRDDKSGTTVYEGRMAWSEIPPVRPGVGSSFYLTFLVNDDDGSGRKWMEWTPGIANTKDVDQFAEVKMVE